MELGNLITLAHANARAKGFWDDYDWAECNLSNIKPIVCQKLLLIISEVIEATEALREDSSAEFESELADVAIRLADLCGGLKVDLETAVNKKMHKNQSRGKLHGKSF